MPNTTKTKQKQKNKQQKQKTNNNTKKKTKTKKKPTKQKTKVLLANRMYSVPADSQFPTDSVLYPKWKHFSCNKLTSFATSL